MFRMVRRFGGGFCFCLDVGQRDWLATFEEDAARGEPIETGCNVEVVSRSCL